MIISRCLLSIKSIPSCLTFDCFTCYHYLIRW
nr:MAG TPA: hypothetical protein [Caudoviricetes sp.]